MGSRAKKIGERREPSRLTRSQVEDRVKRKKGPERRHVYRLWPIGIPAQAPDVQIKAG